VSDHDSVFGDTALGVRFARHQVKGNLLAARPRYVRERWGEDGIRRVAALLAAEVRPVLDAEILPFIWYPLDQLAAVDRAIIEGPMNGDATQMKEFGATIARYDLSTIYKVLFKVGSPAFVIRRVNVAYSTYIRGGIMRGETPSPSQATVTFVNGTFPMYLCRYGVAGWLTAAIELSGGRAVQVSEVDCVHDGAMQCRLQARWQ
jgi:hypothetical protein